MKKISIITILCFTALFILNCFIDPQKAEATTLDLSTLIAFGRMVIGQLYTPPVIPEPATMSLLGLGLLGLVGFRKKKS